MVPLLITIIALLIIGGGVYVYESKKANKITDASTQTQTGQNYIVENGNQADPILHTTIINNFLSAKAIYSSGDLVVIRKYLLNAIPAGPQQQKIANLPDSNLNKAAAVYNEIYGVVTESILRRPDTT